MSQVAGCSVCRCAVPAASGQASSSAPDVSSESPVRGMAFPWLPSGPSSAKEPQKEAWALIWGCKDLLLSTSEPPEEAWARSGGCKGLLLPAKELWARR